MAVCTNTEVFTFCGCPADVITAQGSAVTTLIANVEDEIEKTIGRKITATTFTDVIFQHGLNCEIYDDKIFLKGKYRDTYSLSAVSENGVALTAVAAYDDGGGYYLDSRIGQIFRNLLWWSKQPFAIKMTGSMNVGLTASVSPAIKQIAIEMTAAKSGLWKMNVETEGGTIVSVRTTPTKATMENLQKFILKDF